MSSILFNIIKGFVYGSFSIIPGLSGGVIASFFGDYQNILDIIMSRKIFLKNIVYLLSIFSGFFIGVVITSRFVMIFYSKCYILFFSFILLVNFVLLAKLFLKVKIKDFTTNISKFFPLILLFSLLIYIVPIFKNGLFFHFLCGIIYSFSKVIPGVSSSAMLINIGFYDDFMYFVSNPILFLRESFFQWTIFLISFFISTYFFLRLLKILIKSYIFDFFLLLIILVNFIALIISF